MKKTSLHIPPEFEAATTDERIAFVQLLWDKIAEECDDLPLPAHHKAILEERLEAHRTHPDAGVPWVQLRDELLEQFRAR